MILTYALPPSHTHTHTHTHTHIHAYPYLSFHSCPNTQFKVLPPSQIQQQNVAPVRPESKNKMPLNPPKMTIE